MKKIISNIVFIVYLIIAIFLTVCLLSYNDYKVTEFGDTSLVIVSDKKMEPDFNKGDLVIVEKSDDIKTGDKVFYYDTYNQKIKVKLGEIVEVEKINQEQTNYVLDDGEHKISSEYVIGPSSEASTIKKMGTVLGIVESKWGFLFLIVFPALLAFVNQAMVVAKGIKEAKKETQKEESDPKEKTKEKENI